jgi:peptidoglycan/LPS O-acetylase OafA/YrhL
MKQEGLYFKNLDALRAMAALAVVLTHLALWLPAPATDWAYICRRIMSFDRMGGTYGVYFFFILSGFLITYRLLLEKQEKQKINVPHFYWRRILRIWPLYFLSIIIGFVIYPACMFSIGRAYTENASPALYAVFLTNFDHFWNGTSTNGMLGVQWSVAVEEQFYLGWPLLFLGRIRPVLLLILMGALLVGSECFFLANAPGPRSYYHFLSCLRFLAAGGMIGLFSFYYPASVQAFFRRIPKMLSAAIAFSGVLVLFFATELTNWFNPFKYLVHLLPFMFFAFVILEQCFSPNKWLAFGRFKGLNYLGKISYGLYLWHMVAIYMVLAIPGLDQPQLFGLNVLLALLLTMALSACSFRYLETPFLRWKSRFSEI